MIDTDKYEGHTEGPWCIDECDGYETSKYNPAGIHIYALRLNKDIVHYPISTGDPLALHVARLSDKSPDKIKTSWANAELMANAPLLFEEVKRLREQVECSKGEHEWELDDYLDGDPNEPVRIVETCVACGLTRERIE
jgi:dipeptidase